MNQKNNVKSAVWTIAISIILTGALVGAYFWKTAIVNWYEIAVQILFLNVIIFTVYAGIGLAPSYKKLSSFYKKYHKLIFAIYLSFGVPIIGYLIDFGKFILHDNENNEKVELLDSNKFLMFSSISILGALASVIFSEKAAKMELIDQNKEYRWDSDEILELLYNESSDNIKLIQTWFPDAARIADFFVRKDISQTAKKVKNKTIKIYILDPDCPFALERYKSINGFIHENLFQDNSTVVVPLSDTELKRLHRAHFVTSLDNFIQRFAKMSGVNIEIFTYKIQANQAKKYKIYRIDDKNMFASDFGGSGSTRGIAEFFDQEEIEKLIPKTPNEERIKENWNSLLDYLASISKTENLIYKKIAGEANQFGKLYKAYHSWLH